MCPSAPPRWAAAPKPPTSGIRSRGSSAAWWAYSFISLGSSAGPNLPTHPNGATVTVTSRSFGAGLRIRNAGAESATLRFRLELGGGLGWGNDVPDPSEDCTATATVGECAPPIAFEQTPSFHLLEFAWDVVAPQPGTYTLRAEIVSSSTTDTDPSNNVATLTVVVAEPPSGGEAGSAGVTASRASLTPRKPRAGSVVTASVRVLSGGVAVRPTRVRCAGTVGGSKLAATPRAASGRASCLFRPRASARGKTLRGTITFRVGATNVTRRFSVRLG